MPYTYPDRNDALTIALISGMSQGEYWEQSEGLALDWALEAADLLPRPRRMLDLGCGTGRLLTVFAPHVDEILAVEPDKERCAAAAAAAQRIAGRVEVRHGDALAVEPGRQFELLLCSHVIQHIDDAALQTLLAAMSVHSAPKALAVVATTFTPGSRSRLTAEWWKGGARHCEELDEEGFRAAFSREGVLPVRLFAKNSVQALFEGAGFALEGLRLYHYPNGTDAKEDACRSERGDETARDAIYLFRKI